MADHSANEQPGEVIDDGKGRIFPCEGCGADLSFHIGQQQLKCPYCGFEKELLVEVEGELEERDYLGMLRQLEHWKEEGHTQETGQSEVRCEACGGNVVFQGALTSSECPYCATPIQRDKVHDAEHRIAVDGVLPFLVERRRAKAQLKQWVESRWFAPNDFKSRGVDGKFNGVYLPFWTFDSLTHTRYSGERGENYVVEVVVNNQRRQETRVRWWPASGQFQRFFDDILISATKGLPTWMLDRLSPWPLDKLLPYTPEVLAGFFARTYETELNGGFSLARRQIENAIEADVRHRIGGDHQRVHSCHTHYDAITFKHLLLPVWLLAYRYGDRSYQVAVNAATGEVQGERPYSVAKIAIAVLLGVIAVGILVVLLNR